VSGAKKVTARSRQETVGVIIRSVATGPSAPRRPRREAQIEGGPAGAPAVVPMAIEPLGDEQLQEGVGSYPSAASEHAQSLRDQRRPCPCR